MYSKTGHDPLPGFSQASFSRTTTFRLTLWYTILSCGLALAVFFAVYLSLESHLRARTDNELKNTAKEFETLLRSRGVKALQAEFDREARSRGINRVLFRLFSHDGRVLAASNMKFWSSFALDPNVRAAISNPTRQVFLTVKNPQYQHGIRILINRLADNKIMQLGSVLRSEDITLERYRETFGTALIMMLVCGSVGGWLLARKAMSGVRRVACAANNIGWKSLGQRIRLLNEGEEISTLVNAFNAMLERIEFLVSQLQQITDDAAHELRTPITRMRGIAETTMNTDNLAEYHEMAAQIVAECDRLVEMIGTMLEITRVDCRVTDLGRENLDLNRIIEDAIDLFGPLAENRGISIKLEAPTGSAPVTGDRSKLQRVVANLLDNAIKYGNDNTVVKITIASGPTHTRMEINNIGNIIPANELPHVFTRFFRCDKSRSTPGSGLGLSLALAIARAHDGNITATSCTKHGTTFTLVLPLARMP